MKPHEHHRAESPGNLQVRIVTVSTSRYNAMKHRQEFSDEAGDVAERMAIEAGFGLTMRHLVSDESAQINREVRHFLASRDDVLLMAGGTGLSNRDVTIETVKPFFEKELDGFGELLRQTSHQKIGAAAALTRSTAGVAKGKLIICMPGSPDAVQTALGVFIGEVPHAVHIARS